MIRLSELSTQICTHYQVRLMRVYGKTILLEGIRYFNEDVDTRGYV